MSIKRVWMGYRIEYRIGYRIWDWSSREVGERDIERAKA